MWRFPTIIPLQDTDSQQQLPIDAIFKTAENSTVGIVTGSDRKRFHAQQFVNIELVTHS
jgi:hypothetical protein